MIAALPEILRRHPHTHLLVVGSGAFREVLEALVYAIATGNQTLFDHLSAHALTLDQSDAKGGRVGPLRPHFSCGVV